MRKGDRSGIIECAADCVVCSSRSIRGIRRKAKDTSDDLGVAGTGARKVCVSASGHRRGDGGIRTGKSLEFANQPASVVLSPNAMN